MKEFPFTKPIRKKPPRKDGGKDLRDVTVKEHRTRKNRRTDKNKAIQEELDDTTEE